MKYVTKSYEELSFTDDFMFCKIMTANPDLCQELLELILQLKIRRIEFPEAQKEIRHTFDSKGIRMDVYVEDDENTVYDIEMQTTVRPDLAKRIRYYQGMIDLNLISTGKRYRELKQTYIIFLCTDDPFGRNLPIYHFANICREDRTLELSDEANKVIINANGNRGGLSKEMTAFLDYLRSSRIGDDFTERLQKQVERNRIHEEWRQDYMTWAMELEDIRDDLREDKEFREEIKKEIQIDFDQKLKEKDKEIALLKAQLAAQKA